MNFNMQEFIYNKYSLSEKSDVYEFVENNIKRCLSEFLGEPDKQSTHTEYLVWRDIQRQLEKEQ